MPETPGRPPRARHSRRAQGALPIIRPPLRISGACDGMSYDDQVHEIPLVAGAAGRDRECQQSHDSAHCRQGSATLCLGIRVPPHLHPNSAPAGRRGTDERLRSGIVSGTHLSGGRSKRATLAAENFLCRTLTLTATRNGAATARSHGLTIATCCIGGFPRHRGSHARSQACRCGLGTPNTMRCRFKSTPRAGF